MIGPVDFEGSNFKWLGPPGQNCVDLPAFRHEGGTIFCIRFSPEELEEISKTGCVWVSMTQQTMPMILMSAEPLVSVPDGKGGMRPSKPEPYIAPARVGGLIPVKRVRLTITFGESPNGSRYTNLFKEVAGLEPKAVVWRNGNVVNITCIRANEIWDYLVQYGHCDPVVDDHLITP